MRTLLFQEKKRREPVFSGRKTSSTPLLFISKTQPLGSPYFFEKIDPRTLFVYYFYFMKNFNFSIYGCIFGRKLPPPDVICSPLFIDFLNIFDPLFIDFLNIFYPCLFAPPPSICQSRVPSLYDWTIFLIL